MEEEEASVLTLYVLNEHTHSRFDRSQLSLFLPSGAEDDLNDSEINERCLRREGVTVTDSHFGPRRL